MERYAYAIYKRKKIRKFFLYRFIKWIKESDKEIKEDIAKNLAYNIMCTDKELTSSTNRENSEQQINELIKRIEQYTKRREAHRVNRKI